MPVTELFGGTIKAVARYSKREAQRSRMRAVTSEGGIDEIFGEPLGLRLRANENRDAEDDAGKTQDERALAMAQEAQRDVEWRRHRWSVWRELRHSLPDKLPRTQFVLIGEHHAVAFGKAGDDLGEFERAVTDLDGAGLDDAVFHDQRLINEEGAGRAEENIFMGAGDDVHLAGHAGHQVLGRILEIQNNGVTLGLGIGRRLDGGNFRAEFRGSGRRRPARRLPCRLSLHRRLLRSLLRGRNSCAMKS